MRVFVNKDTTDPKMVRWPDMIQDPDNSENKIIDPNFLADYQEMDDQSAEYLALFDPYSQLSDLEKSKLHKSSEIDGRFELEMNTIKDGYTPSEILSWDRQDLEAKALDADSNAMTPLLDGIAFARGITKATLKAKVLVNVASFEAIAGTLIGTRQKLQDEIESATKVADVEAISWG